MSCETRKTNNVLIADCMGLKQVNVYLEDFGPGSGKITISHESETWSAYWSAMGKTTAVDQFFCRCDEDYLIGCLAPYLQSSIFCGMALQKLARKSVIERRIGWRHRNYDFDGLEKEEARALYAMTQELHNADSIQWLFHRASTEMNELFGPEWWNYASDATKPNPRYQFMCGLIDGVQRALKSQERTAA